MGVERDFTHPGGVLKTVCDRSGGHTWGGGTEQICVTVTVSVQTSKIQFIVLFTNQLTVRDLEV